MAYFFTVLSVNNIRGKLPENQRQVIHLKVKKNSQFKGVLYVYIGTGVCVWGGVGGYKRRISMTEENSSLRRENHECSAQQKICDLRLWASELIHDPEQYCEE